AVTREHRRARLAWDGPKERQVLPLLLANAAVHTARNETVSRRHAHTRTPVSRSPRVSSRPSARFAFWTAWPAAPLPRLSSAQTTIAFSVARSSKSAISAA